MLKSKDGVIGGHLDDVVRGERKAKSTYLAATRYGCAQRSERDKRKMGRGEGVRARGRNRVERKM